MLDYIRRVRVRAVARGSPGLVPRAADSVPRLGERGVPGEERRRARERRRHRMRIRSFNSTRRDVPDSGETLEAFQNSITKNLRQIWALKNGFRIVLR